MSNTAKHIRVFSPTEDQIAEAVIQDDINICLNDLDYLRSFVVEAFEGYTPEQFAQEYALRGLGADLQGAEGEK